MSFWRGGEGEADERGWGWMLVMVLSWHEGRCGHPHPAHVYIPVILESGTVCYVVSSSFMATHICDLFQLIWMSVSNCFWFSWLVTLGLGKKMVSNEINNCKLWWQHFKAQHIKIKNYSRGVYRVGFVFLVLQKAKDLYCRFLNIMNTPPYATWHDP